jgi:DNA invertase Pin-like site-specific DNA recombinase
VYIRQSSPQQVKHNLESQRRQYALRERAVVLGWEPGAVVVVDEDQGRSGQDEERAGFQRLQRAVACGEVGVLFNLEVSRLSRQSSAWAALIEVCRWQQTLLGDEENLYDPNLADDRLLLGLRGLLGEVELETLRQRMQVSREEKARRGELRFHPPTGLVWDGGEGFRRDPDEEVQGAVHLLFEQFRRLGSAAAVVRSFGEEGLLFPTRHFGGVREEEVEWQPLTYLRTLQVLHNPLYAGAYAYGRRAYSRSRKPRERWGQRGVGLAEEEWLVVQWEAFPGYVSREEYEANQRRLAANQPRGEEGGAVREGEALLSGRVLCGRCGQRMQVAYAGTGGRYPVYVCRPGRKEGQNRVCQQVSAAGVDRKVVEAVLEALTPAAVEVSLEVVEEVAQQQALLRQQWERRVERVRYEAALAERRYRQVEPENRLVARTL